MCRSRTSSFPPSDPSPPAGPGARLLRSRVRHVAHQSRGGAARRRTRGVAAPGRASTRGGGSRPAQRFPGGPVRASPADARHHDGPRVRGWPDRRACAPEAQRRPCHGPWGRDPSGCGAHQRCRSVPGARPGAAAVGPGHAGDDERRRIPLVGRAGHRHEADDLWQQARGVGVRMGIPLRGQPRRLAAPGGLVGPDAGTGRADPGHRHGAVDGADAHPATAPTGAGLGGRRAGAAGPGIAAGPIRAATASRGDIPGRDEPDSSAGASASGPIWCRAAGGRCRRRGRQSDAP